MPRTAFIIGFFTLIAQFGLATAVHSDAVEIRDGFVILQASVNGKSGNYILDSGAPGLVANAQHHEAKSSKDNMLQGVNGPVPIALIPSWSFRWNNFTQSGRDAYAIDLSYLESDLEMEIAGIVGLDVFNGYYVLIDYARGEMELWRDMPETSLHNAWVEFPIEMHEHVPVITMTRDKQEFKFGIDTGAESNLLDSNVCGFITSGITQLDMIQLVGINQQRVRSSEVQISGFASGPLEFPKMNFVTTDLAYVAAVTDVKLDGILGQPFLSGRVILIDRNRNFIRMSNVIQLQERMTDSPVVLIASR